MKLRGNEKVRGFALVLTITLLSLLVIIALAISQTARLDADMSTASRAQVSAKQNALSALQLALCDLQVAAGPDDRITGMAGVVGVSAQNSLRQWTGVWGGDNAPVWLASGANKSSTPSYNGNPITIVGPKSVGNPTNRSEQELVEVGMVPIFDAADENLVLGHYAYWVADEGAKVSAVVPDADAQTSVNTGRLLRPDSKRLVSSSFNPSDLAHLNIIALNQLPLTAASVSLVSSFHSLTVTHKALPLSVPDGTPSAGGFVVGAININTTSAPVWRAMLEYPDRDNSAYGLTTNAALNNSRKISDRISARGAPFQSIAELVASGIIHDAFAVTPNKVTSPTADEFLNDLVPILAVRSDTFRIRAYGDAMNPADADDPNAKPEAVAYCEAIVQRTNQDDPGGHGKKFVITYFRWLGPDDI